MVTTLTCSLKPTVEQATELLRMMEAFNAACDYASEVAWETREFNGYRLRGLTYGEIRRRFGLPAQLAQHAVKKVSDAYKLDKKTRRTFSTHGAVTFDCRCFRLLGVSVASMTLLSGREKIKLSIGGYHANKLKGAVLGETNLCFQPDKNRFRLHFSIKEPDPPKTDPTGFLGVDLGIVNLAVSSDGEVFSSAELKSVRHRHRRLRTKLQAKGTKASRRLLKQRSKKEQRYARHQNHVVSKRIVSVAKRTSRGIALEDLQGIGQRIRVHRSQIGYKAQSAGMVVVFVDPKNTSRTCPACGHVAKANRPCQSKFHCVSCGCSGFADHFASVEIGRRAQAISKGAARLGDGETTVAPGTNAHVL